MKYYIGIDLGGTNIAAGVVNENKEIVAKTSIKTGSGRDVNLIVDDMALAAKTAAEGANLTFDDVEWIGIGAPGTANKATGIIEYSNNLDWYNVPLVSMLEERTGKKVFIENDANAAAYGEYVAGAAKDADSSVMVTLGTGVGGGIVLNNKIYTGFNFAGAELGHSVIVVDGRQCTCGRKGCLEAYASATGLIVTTKEYMEQYKDSAMWDIVEGDISKVNGRTAFDAMRKGDEAGKLVVDEYIKYLACGVTNIINTFQPDILCIGGGISHEGDTLMVPLKEIVAREVYSRNSARNTEIVAASLGNDAGIIGAALLGLAD
ncbi:ROK family protein [Phocea massiliensis]|uniref:ROK family protein n=1 Tax=Merdimmobilis hominis TaxID=2897707 RepID=A0A938X749_9FIRM|nr:ROK family protein [Merdimmobilis hominis]MBM6921078.1 ROK family protein [Merdimmobilis hominis]